MNAVVDEFAWWRAAIAGKPGIVEEAKPESGYYKMRAGKDGPWLPVAIWRKDGEIVCRIGKTMRDPVEVWTFVAKNPIAKEIAKVAFETGNWPDQPEPIEQRPNMPTDPFEAMKVEIEDRAAQAARWLAAHPDITTQLDCDLARNMQAQLIKLGNNADDDRKTEKRPLIDAGKAIEAKFEPLITTARTWAERLREVYERFLKSEERRRQAEAQKKYEAECAAREKERQRIAAEQAKKMADDPIQALTEPPPEIPELPLAPDPVKVQAGGGIGRKAGLRTVYVGVIEDYRKAMEHFAEHPDLKAVIDKLVSAAVRAGKDTTKIPGVRVHEDRRAA